MKKINTNGSESSLDFFSTRGGRTVVRPSVGDGISFKDWFKPAKQMVCVNFEHAFSKRWRKTVVYCRYTNQKITLNGLYKKNRLSHGYVLITYQK